MWLCVNGDSSFILYVISPESWRVLNTVLICPPPFSVYLWSSRNLECRWRFCRHFWTTGFFFCWQAELSVQIQGVAEISEGRHLGHVLARKEVTACYNLLNVIWENHFISVLCFWYSTRCIYQDFLIFTHLKKMISPSLIFQANFSHGVWAVLHVSTSLWVGLVNVFPENFVILVFFFFVVSFLALSMIHFLINFTSFQKSGKKSWTGLKVKVKWKTYHIYLKTFTFSQCELRHATFQHLWSECIICF